MESEHQWFREKWKMISQLTRVLAVIGAFVCLTVVADDEKIVNGVHGYTPDTYVQPTDPAVLAELEKFRDRKLGIMMHFGPYALMGNIESWPLVDSEASWSRVAVDWTSDGEQLKREYWALNKAFYPVRFQPEYWASLAKRTGFKYLVFTTKHHDGFCMFDSKYSDYKVTAPECPFSTHPKANVVKCIFDAFRKEGLAISAYFSKPDWHHPDYWDNCGMGVYTTRNPTYDFKKDTVRWSRFAQYTKNQLLELVRDYGPIDCLWLDGGQVRRKSGQDIKIEDILEEARKVRPGLLCADRLAGGMSENIITPEQTVPKDAIAAPWESCVTMATGFSYRYDETFKSPRQLIHLLIDIVAKGGNLALNVAPGPDGRLPDPAIERMRIMGAWLDANGEAIYATRAISPYRKERWAFTVSKDERTAYAIWLYGEERGRVRRFTLPKQFETVATKAVHLASGRQMAMGRDGEGGITMTLPEDVANDLYADAFRLER